MRDALALALAALVGCGRVGFDARPEPDARSDGGPPGISISLELPAGGQFRDLATSPIDTAWYALGDRGDAFRSLDGGATWVRCGAVNDSTALEVGTDGTVYASGGTMLASTDRCATWSDMVTPRYSLTAGIAGSTVYALSDDGLYRFENGNWLPVPTPLGGAIFQSFASSPTTQIAGTYGKGLVVSPDGTSWTQKLAGLPTLAVVDVAVSATRSYALTAAMGGANGGVGCSDGTGVTWTECLPTGGTALALDPLDSQHVLVATYDELGETVNAFGMFTIGLRKAAGLDDAIVRDLAYAPDGTALAATDRGVFSSRVRPLAFGGSQSGLSAWTIEHVVRDRDDVFVSTRGGVLRSHAGSPFTLSTSGMTFNTGVNRFAIAPDGTLLAPGRFVWGSRDRGDTWSPLLALDGNDRYYANVVAFDGERAFVGTETRIHVAGPPYTTWVTFAIGGDQTVRDLAVVGGALYAATDSGLHVSLDGAASWQRVMAVAVPARALGALADGGLAVATATGVFVSNPTRTVWVQHLAAVDYRSLVVDGDRIVAISFDDGASTTTDRGASWTDLQVPRRLLTTGIVDPADGSLVLGTAGFGLVRVALP